MCATQVPGVPDDGQGGQRAPGEGADCLGSAGSPHFSFSGTHWSCSSLRDFPGTRYSFRLSSQHKHRKPKPDCRTQDTSVSGALCCRGRIPKPLLGLSRGKALRFQVSKHRFSLSPVLPTSVNLDVLPAISELACLPWPTMYEGLKSCGTEHAF